MNNNSELEKIIADVYKLFDSSIKGMTIEETAKMMDTMCGKDANNINSLYKLLTRSTGVDEMLTKFTGIDYDVDYDVDYNFDKIFERDDTVTREKLFNENDWEKLFEIIVGKPCGNRESSVKGGSGSAGGMGTLNANIENTDDGCVIVCKNPGMNKNNTTIKIEDDKINIDFEFTGSDKKGFKRSATFTLSDKLNLKKIDTHCKDGILTIFIPIKKVNIIQVEIN